MDTDRLYRWVLETFDKYGEIAKEKIDEIGHEDADNINFFLSFLVEKGLVKAEIMGNKTRYLSNDIQKIKELLGYQEIKPQTISLEDALVVSIPLSMSSSLSSLIAKTKDIKVVELKSVLKSLIESSTKEILIASPFMEIDGIMYILDEIINAAKRGVSIKIISRDILVKKNYDFSYTNKLKGISKLYEIYEQNKANPSASLMIRDFGTEISQHSGSSTHYEGIHQKMLIVDRSYAYVGSGEIRASSFITNGEAGALFVGKKAEFWTSFFELFWKQAHDIPKDFLDSNI